MTLTVSKVLAARPQFGSLFSELTSIGEAQERDLPTVTRVFSAERGRTIAAAQGMLREAARGITKTNRLIVETEKTFTFNMNLDATRSNETYKEVINFRTYRDRIYENVLAIRELGRGKSWGQPPWFTVAEDGSFVNYLGIFAYSSVLLLPIYAKEFDQYWSVRIEAEHRCQQIQKDLKGVTALDLAVAEKLNAIAVVLKQEPPQGLPPGTAAPNDTDSTFWSDFDERQIVNRTIPTH
jgi:hypothetical protein